MTDKVVGIRGVTVTGEPSKAVVELLERVLERAKAGDLRAVGIAEVTGGYAFNATFAIDGPYSAALLGAATMLAYRVAKNADDG